jgi:DNA-binding transcriptional ArsR family regulator
MVEHSPGRLDEVFHALSNQTRRSILEHLARSDCTVGELASPHEMSLAAVAKHIDVLERAGLVNRLKEGRNTRCRLNPAGFAHATVVLDYYRQFWTDQLDALEQYFEERNKGRHDEA